MLLFIGEGFLLRFNLVTILFHVEYHANRPSLSLLAQFYPRKDLRRDGERLLGVWRSDLALVALGLRLHRRQKNAPAEEHTIIIMRTGHCPLWSGVKYIDRDPHFNTRRVKEAIHVRLRPKNISRNSEFEISEAWMPTIKNPIIRRAVWQRTAAEPDPKMHQSQPWNTIQSQLSFTDSI